MEKYGSISCPFCKSNRVTPERDARVEVKHASLIKIAAHNQGETYRCLECLKTFAQITNSGEHSEGVPAD